MTPTTQANEESISGYREPSIYDALTWLWQTTVDWIIALVQLIAGAAIACTLLMLVLMAPSIVFGWLFGPTEAERAAQGAARLAWIEEISRKEVDTYGKKYVATCGSAPYPSSRCPAYYVYVGDAGEDLGRMIAEGTEEDRDEHPCFAGQIKANRRSNLYHLPEGQFYAVTRADTLCYESIESAVAAGYRPSPR